MKAKYNIDGMTCSSCQKRVSEAISSIDGVIEVEVNLKDKEATLTTHRPISLDELNKNLPPRYVLDEKSIEERDDTQPFNPETSKLVQLRPLILILTYILIASIWMNMSWNTEDIMADFMGLFFIVFSFFKILDLKGFPASFAMYDPIAKRIPLYGKVYPFIETVLGIMLLNRWHIEWALGITILILSFTTYGVVQSLLSNKKIRCACLGTALNLPMTEATFIENALMIIMSLLMLF